MNRFFLVMLPLLLAACSIVDEDDSLYEQSGRIDTYLQGLGSVYTVDGDIYKEVIESEDEDDEQYTGVLNTLERGDTLYIYFAQYDFTTSPGSLYYTNIASLAEAAGLQLEDEDLEPLEIIYGTSDIISGLETGLKNSTEGEEFNLYIPSDFAYGAEQCGVLPEFSTIMMYVMIYKIDKK